MKCFNISIEFINLIIYFLQQSLVKISHIINRKNGL